MTPSAQTTRSRLPLVLILAAMFSNGVAHLVTSTMPFQVGALIDGAGFSAGTAGTFGFCEVGMFALSMIAVAGRVDRISPRVLALLGVSLLCGANLAIFFVHAHLAGFVFGPLAGIGYGFIFAASIAAVAAVPNPDRIYGITTGGALVVIVMTIAALPAASRLVGPMGPFLGLAITGIITLPFLLGFGWSGAPVTQVKQQVLSIRGAPGLLFGWASFSLGTGALWSFAERIGHGLALAPETIGSVLATGTFAGLIGTGTAAWFGGRLGRKIALAVGFLGSGLACLLLGFSIGIVTYAAGVLLYWIFYMFLYSYLLGTAAALDPYGRVGTFAGGLERLGFAIGAGIGGLLADHSSYPAIGLLGFGGCIVGLVVGMPSVLRGLRHEPALVIQGIGTP